jgi:hypothetical protein
MNYEAVKAIVSEWLGREPVPGHVLITLIVGIILTNIPGVLKRARNGFSVHEDPSS